MTPWMRIVLTGLAVAQCAVVDILLIHDLSSATAYLSIAAHLVVALHTGATARALITPVVGRTCAVVALLLVSAVCLCLPAGRGLAGLLLLPFAATRVQSRKFR